MPAYHAAQRIWEMAAKTHKKKKKDKSINPYQCLSHSAGVVIIQVRYKGREGSKRETVTEKRVEKQLR